MNNTISFEISLEKANEIKELYKDYLVDSPNQYILYMIKFDLYSITIYKSLKIVIQGKDILNVANSFGYVPKNWDLLYTQIGSDEVGTGDFFGPIVVCATYVKENEIEYLKSIGVNDSKKLTDSFIMKNVPNLLKKFSHCIMYIPNEQYNELQDNDYNLNRMKAVLHNKCLLKLSKEHHIKDAIIDQFCKEETYYNHLLEEKEILNGIYFTTKGESHAPSVALASMFARYAFLLKVEELEKEYGVKIPLGASSQVQEYALKLKDEKGEEFLKHIAKMNFKFIK